MAAAKGKHKPDGPGDQEILQNLRYSSANALQALEHFKASLVAAGFVRSADAYVTMADTLVGQRLWSVESADSEVETRFCELADCAAEIDRILAPFVEAMQKIAMLQGLAQSARETAARDLAAWSDDPVLLALDEAAQGLTTTALRARTGLSTRALRDRLETLEADGLIVVRRSGRRSRWVAAGGDGTAGGAQS